ncbi:peptidoglycan DD-metalloendopeptidase family protein [Motilimonas sp. 1_MG-2023]|uniref:peptidoglycan DD-metalloendopeptidase family protein n=1 Tax=Motilimonas sp. 1_MG-2023 TaxID=3062672 RepID=UPI0026E4509C|nr:peptidoglycan DD-metalloendopeptidase family protein [Motilimonas sp. 1_MG-2023]MDO6525735.1 peptidoglycan DD-metalloendopeptidase family protein [Motilimonas sp. 1_MG-2023]
MSFSAFFKKKHLLLSLSLFALLFLILRIPVQSASVENVAMASTTTSVLSHQDLNELLEPGEQKYVIGEKYPLPLVLEPDTVKKANPTISTTKSPSTDLLTETITVEQGDSLAVIFQRAGLSAKTLFRIDNLGGDAHKLRRIHPGEKIEFTLTSEGKFHRLRYPYNSTETLVVNKETKGFSASIETLTLEARTEFIRADIVSSFWNAGMNSGLEVGVIMDLANIFGWDVDFALDIRQGDSFAVLYERLYHEGEFVKTGKILAAEFINQGEVFQAVRSEDGSFYTPDGKAMRKAFLRAPVNFKYISSSFNPKRRHPVTGKIRAHRGIDYAARTGTPVVSAGDGKVITSGYNKFNGNYVVIKHSSSYITKYLHLNKRFVKQNQRVKQGDKIGTVGATGRVTGAHLHYEFLVNGVHTNPKTVKLPQAESLSGQARDEFIAYSTPYISALNTQNRLMLANN